MAKFLAYVALAAISLQVIVANVFPNQQVFQTGYEQLNELYEVSWDVDEDQKVIKFHVTAKTKGWVGLGISPFPNMTDSDLFIGGVDETSNVTLYGSDYHGTGNTRPAEDASIDWIIDEGTENNTHTQVSFHRKLDTSDVDEDIVITNETLIIIWAIGVSDNLSYHGNTTRGTKSINLLNPGSTNPPDTTTPQGEESTAGDGSTAPGNTETTTESSGDAITLTKVLIFMSILSFLLM